MLARLLALPGGMDARARIVGLAAEGGLAYWMDDHPAVRRACEERLTLAETTGDPELMADAHYDLGFVHVVDADSERLREHEARALELYLVAGREDGAVRARQALAVAVFLAGEYQTARELELQNLEAFERRGSVVEVADSQALLTAISWRRGDLDAARRYLAASAEGFLVTDSASGIARVLAMAAIVCLTGDQPELGARAAGAAYRQAREKSLMLAPMTVLHLPGAPGGRRVEALRLGQPGRGWIGPRMTPQLGPLTISPSCHSGSAASSSRISRKRASCSGASALRR